MKRCPWCEGFDLYRQYHDEEWGVPLRDDRALFELLILEGAQAGLSWSTVLKKRENYRVAFNKFDPKKIAKYDLSLATVPAKSPESDAMSKALLKAGFKFVGSTICYAFMQASGMINDHLVSCHRYQVVKKLS